MKGKPIALLFLIAFAGALLVACEGEDPVDSIQETSNASLGGDATSGEATPGEAAPADAGATEPAHETLASELAADTVAVEETGIEPVDEAESGNPFVGPEAKMETTSRSTIDGVIADGEYAHETSISRMEVFWSNNAETLYMAIVAPGAGYVAVGFDPVDRKVGANYILGWVDENGATLRDHMGTRGNLHEPDTALGGTDDILAFAGTEIDRATTIEFAIPLDSGDPFDRPLAPGETYVLHVAYHRSRDNDFAVHTGWGIGELVLDPAP